MHFSPVLLPVHPQTNLKEGLQKFLFYHLLLEIVASQNSFKYTSRISSYYYFCRKMTFFFHIFLPILMLSLLFPSAYLCMSYVCIIIKTQIDMHSMLVLSLPFTPKPAHDVLSIHLAPRIQGKSHVVFSRREVLWRNVEKSYTVLGIPEEIMQKSCLKLELVLY